MSKKVNTKLISELGKRFSDSIIFMHEAIAKKAGLSGSDHKYLSFIIKDGPITAGELAKISGLTTGAVTGLVDRLSKRKLVKRKADAIDRRKILIIPNHEMIEKLLGDPSTQLKNKMVKLISNFPQNEIDIIERYLLSSIKIMEDLTISLKKQKRKPL